MRVDLVSPSHGSRHNDSAIVQVMPEEIDRSYKNYYKDYKDGIDESMLDRYRQIIHRRQLEKEKAEKHKISLTVGRGRTIKYRTPFGDFNDSSVNTSTEKKKQSP